MPPTALTARATGIVMLWIGAVTACGSVGAVTPHAAAGANVVLEEEFSQSTFNPGWIAKTPGVIDAGVRLEGGTLRLTMPPAGNGEVVVRHRFDAARLRGRRVLLSVRGRSDAPASTLARAELGVAVGRVVASYADGASTAAIRGSSWVDVHAVMDVAGDAADGNVALVLRGPGSVWFDRMTLTVVGPAAPAAAVQLSPEQVANLMTFSRAAALIRYLHPSDQAADLDWDEFGPNAIDRVLQVHGTPELLTWLRTTFAPIAPTVTFSTTADARSTTGMRPGDATHLARWQRYGLATSDDFDGFREGRDLDGGRAHVSTRVRLAGFERCRSLELRGTTRKRADAGTGTASLFARVLGAGEQVKEIAAPIADGATSTSLSVELPPGTQELELGMHVRGRSAVTLEGLSLACAAGPSPHVDLDYGRWQYTGMTALYRWDVATCGTNPCATLQRKPLDTEWVQQRDVLDADIGGGLRIHLPLAVWADATRTLPITSPPAPARAFAIHDLPTRLAAVSAAWGTLSLFYPYFADQRTDWLAALAPALEEAAAAQTPQDTHTALAHLVAHLHDNHARVTHPAASIAGVLPIAFRRFGDQIAVIGGVPDYLKDITVGDELVTIDGVAATTAYDRVATQISAATEGLRHYLAPVRMTLGPPGTFQRVRIRGRDGKEVEHVLPRVSRDLYVHIVRDARPAPGAELAPGVFYVDFDELPAAEWDKLLPALQRARAIVFDFRGYTGSAGFAALANITDHELRSPIWQIPRITGAAITEFNHSQWSIYPKAPRLGARIVALIDGQSMSAVETILEMFRDNQLGFVVGETSGGTNGNVVSFRVPGEFEIRFTAIRVAGEDGSTIQGRGITPDQIVHPTLEGVRAGRDEVLDAGVAAARRLAGT